MEKISFEGCFVLRERGIGNICNFGNMESTWEKRCFVMREREGLVILVILNQHGKISLERCFAKTR